MGVLCSVQRWQAQPLPGAAVPLSCPSASAGRPPAGSTATGPAVRRGPASSRQLLGGSGGAPLMTGSGGAPGPGSGAKPHTSQAPLPRRLRNVQRAHGHFCSSTLSRRIWSRSGLWRGASQMEHWRWPAGFRKVQRAQAHSPTAAMGPGECVWLRARGRGGWCCWVPRLSPHAGLPGPLLPQPAAAGGPGQGSPRGKPWSDSVSAASEEAELPMAPAAARLSAGPGHRVPAAAGEVEHGGGRPREPGSRAGPRSTTEMTETEREDTCDSRRPEDPSAREAPRQQGACSRATARIPPPSPMAPPGRGGHATVASLQNRSHPERNNLGDI